MEQSAEVRLAVDRGAGWGGATEQARERVAQAVVHVARHGRPAAVCLVEGVVGVAAEVAFDARAHCKADLRGVHHLLRVGEEDAMAHRLSEGGVKDARRAVASTLARRSGRGVQEGAREGAAAAREVEAFLLGGP